MIIKCLKDVTISKEGSSDMFDFNVSIIKEAIITVEVDASSSTSGDFKIEIYNRTGVRDSIPFSTLTLDSSYLGKDSFVQSFISVVLPPSFSIKLVNNSNGDVTLKNLWITM